ncbi:MAG: nucleoside triphosphate pyrophosphohydrolase [Verrucomicrobiota bacterium]
MAHPIPSSDLPPIERLRAIMHLLRAPGGCPWDAEQTHETLLKHLIEEAYEVAEAVESGDRDAIVDELGDLLLQPVFHAEIASESGAFDFDDIASAICEKLIRRHPHVFGEVKLGDAGDVLKQWEEIKAAERKEQTIEADYFLKKANEGLPALLAAQKIQKKVSKVGFDWPDLVPVLGKIEEEFNEVQEALEQGRKEEIGEEIGDLLFAVVNLARKTGHEAELLLAGTNRKFVDRFQKVEDSLRKSGSCLEEASLAEMDREWERAKGRPTDKTDETG